MYQFYRFFVMPFVLFCVSLGGCADSNNKTTAGPSKGFVITTDFIVANLSTMTTSFPREVTSNVLGSTGLHSDSVIRTFENRVFIIQRFGSNSIVVIDPDNPSEPLINYSTDDMGDSAPQSNPHDIEFVSLSKAYISRYGQNTLLIVNPLTGEHLGVIDLSLFADSDGIVEMDQMVLVGSTLYVALQRLDQNSFFSASNDSYIAVIDTSTDQLIDTDLESPGVQPIILEGRSPISDLLYLPSMDRIYLANVGNFFTDDVYGGIESVDPNMNATDGIILKDEEIGGALGTLAILNETVAYITIFDENFNNLVIPMDLSTLTVSNPLADIGTGFIADLALDKDGFLYIPDRDITHPGIQVFDTTTNEKVEGPISTGLPPFELAFID